MLLLRCTHAARGGRVPGSRQRLALQNELRQLNDEVETPLTHDSFEEKYTHNVITWYMWHQDNGTPP